MFNLVNASPRPRQGSDILGITVSGLCFLPAWAAAQVKGVWGRHQPGATKASGRAALCCALSRSAELATALFPTGCYWKPVLNRSHSLHLLLKQCTNAPAFNRWSLELKSYLSLNTLNQKFTLKKAEFHRQICTEQGKRSQQSQTRSLSGDFC